MRKIYKARKSSSIKNKDAQIVGETLYKLREVSGHFTTEKVVESATSKKSPLHKYFEWDDTKAAREHRLQQARNIVSSIVEVVVIGGEKVDQKSFLGVTKTNGTTEKVFVILQDAIENPDYRKQLLNKAITTLENLTVTMKLFREHDHD